MYMFACAQTHSTKTQTCAHTHTHTHIYTHTLTNIHVDTHTLKCTNTHFLKHTHPSVPPPYPSTCYCHNPQQDCYTHTHVSASSSLLYAAKGIAISITQAISLHSHSTEHMQYTPTWGHPLPKNPPLIHPPSSACSHLLTHSHFSILVPPVGLRSK